MAQASEIDPEGSVRQRRRLEKKRWRFTLAFGALLLGVLAYAFWTREDIVRDVIAEQLAIYDLDASYTIESIGPDRQVLTDLVIGDPENPDFTAERVEVFLSYQFGVPFVGRLELIRPRLNGSFRDGELSFGTLDKAIFAESDEPPGLPDLDLLLIDGRALIATDFGPIGIKAEGEGELDDGFVGVIAASAPQLALDDCAPIKAGLLGSVSVSDGEPRFAGPLRLESVQCEGAGLALAALDWELDVTADRELAGFTGLSALKADRARIADASVASLAGTTRLSMQDETLTLRFEGPARSLAHPQFVVDQLDMDAVLRARDGFARWDSELSLEGSGVGAGQGLLASLRDWQASTEGTLGEALLAKFRRGVLRSSGAASLSADVTLRQREDTLNLTIPNAVLRGQSGRSIAALSQARLSTGANGQLRWSGNLTTGGEDIPRLSARMEQAGGSALAMQLRLDPYSAGGQTVALPQMRITQTPGGMVAFDGVLEASGDIPGGSVSGFRLPVRASWSQGSGLAAWTQCTDARFASLTLADVALQQGRVTLCPAEGGAMLRSSGGGTKVAARIPQLQLAGRVGDSPLTLESGPITLASSGLVTASDVAVMLGPEQAASRFSATTIDAKLGDAIGGSFSGAEIRLDAVPLDLVETSGEWAFVDDRLVVSNGAFRALDREAEKRFEPLIARDAVLGFADGVVSANATMREPTSDRVVVEIGLNHVMGSGTGFATLDTPALTFDGRLQPDDLTPLLLGVVANAEGVIAGKGRIDWNEEEITSSGAYSSENFDFAAAFGPVKGASGTVEFTDLLSLTTAPGQSIALQSINPGIEVFDGELAFAIRDAQFVSVQGGSWPFMGGTLRLRPVDLDLNSDAERSYVLEIEGLDAAIFVEQMELGNLTAQGIFDGEVPLFFDADGNGRLEDGILTSRDPGGNLSYVGELTYEDMGAVTNFAFQSLRSLDYSEMIVEMNGPLTGEIITRLKFDGVRQGAGASRNFITKRIAKLPIQFRVNIRADFYSLITDLKSLYDPAFVRDPRELGLLDSDGSRLVRPETASPGVPDLPATKPEDFDDKSNDQMNGGEPSIQMQESESMP